MGDELENVLDDDGDSVEADRLQPGDQRTWVDWVAGVVDMEAVQPVAREAVRGDEYATGPEHPQDFGEDGVLKPGGRHVMEHREAANGVERLVGVSEAGRVSHHDLDVRALESLGKSGGDRRVEFYGDKPLHLVAKPLRGSARTWPDLEHRLAEVGVCRHVGHDLVAHVLRPLSSCAQFVVLVHGSHDKEGGPGAKDRNVTFHVAGQTTSSRGPGAGRRELPNAAWPGLRLAHAR